MIAPGSLYPRPRAGTAAVIAVALLAAGCSLLGGPSLPPTQFYVLTTTAPLPDNPGPRRLVIGLGPIDLPPYLDRPEIVIRTGSNKLVFDEFSRWAEPLKDNFIAAIGGDLDKRLALERVVRFPWYSGTKMDFVVVVSVLRFEPQAEGREVVLEARWGIGDPERTVASRYSRYVRPIDSLADAAQGMSSLVGDLSGDIAGAIQAVEAQRHAGEAAR